MSYFKAHIKEVKFNNKLYLKDVHIDIPKKTIVCIVGFSGSGKTSLVNILSGYLSKKYFSGNIMLNNVDVTSLSSYKRRFHSVRHNLFLFENSTVEDNILFGYRDDNKDSTEERKKRLKYLLSIFHISDIASKRVCELSQGQKNRVAIVRSIIDKPAILFLDEAFSHIDHYVKSMIMRDLLIILKLENITTIFITHNIDEMYTLPDSIHIIEDKTIKEVGTFIQLNSEPTTYTSACLVAYCNEIICKIASENDKSIYFSRDNIMFKIDKSKIKNIKHNTKNVSLFFHKDEIEVDTLLSDSQQSEEFIEYNIVRYYKMYNDFFYVIATKLGNFDICVPVSIPSIGRFRIKAFTLLNDYIFNK